MKLEFSFVTPGATMAARASAVSSHGMSTAPPRTPFTTVNRSTTVRPGCACSSMSATTLFGTR
jgi:hypothetical protein